VTKSPRYIEDPAHNDGSALHHGSDLLAVDQVGNGGAAVTNQTRDLVNGQAVVGEQRPPSACLPAQRRCHTDSPGGWVASSLPGPLGSARSGSCLRRIASLWRVWLPCASGACRDDQPCANCVAGVAGERASMQARCRAPRAGDRGPAARLARCHGSVVPPVAVGSASGTTPETVQYLPGRGRTNRK
jgi:hypothetical protein